VERQIKLAWQGKFCDEITHMHIGISMIHKNILVTAGTLDPAAISIAGLATTHFTED